MLPSHGHFSSKIAEFSLHSTGRWYNNKQHTASSVWWISEKSRKVQSVKLKACPERSRMD